MDILTDTRETADRIARIATLIGELGTAATAGDLPEQLLDATESVEAWQAPAVLRGLASHLIAASAEVRELRETLNARGV